MAPGGPAGLRFRHCRPDATAVPHDPPPATFRFGRFDLRPADRQLLADGAPVRLGGRAFDMLVVLAERGGRVVGKRELMDLVWPKLVVEENNLQAQVVALRKVLGAEAIATVPGRGYRLTLHIATAGAARAADAGVPANAAPAPRTHNLPRGIEALIGREREAAQLRSLIAAHRLVTVTGPGGVGKTRLVVDVAGAAVADFADGVWLVELAALANPQLVPSTATGALNIVVPPGTDPLSALAEQLAQRRLLLVLDNCEHVIGAVAALLEATLPAAPGVHAVVSSQELIGIEGEHVLRLGSLTVPAAERPTAAEALAAGAVQLFVARAQAADPAFACDDRNAPVVAAICRRLDGIPLALEMAAARVPLLGLDALAQRLDERFRVLTAGKRTALPRQRTLQATLAWSCGLLSPHEQVLLRRLGVFAGPFSLEAAGAVATDDATDELAVVEALSGLAAKSLVAIDTGDAEARYRLLETTRAYALEMLAEAQETAATTRRHAQYFRRYYAACFDDWTRLSDAAFLARYAPPIDNLRQAIAWAFGPDGDGDAAVALVASSERVWSSLSLYAEFDACVEQARARVTPATPAALEAELDAADAKISANRDKQRVVRCAHRAADYYRSAGDALRLGCALHSLGSAHAAEGDPEAEAALHEARALLDPSGRARLIAMTRSALALSLVAHGRIDEGIAAAKLTLDLWRAAGADRSVLRTRSSLADMVWAKGDLDDAIAEVREVREQLRRTPFPERLPQAYAAANLFGMLVERGDLAEAALLGRTVLPELRALRFVHGWSDHFASYQVRTGNPGAAVRLVGWGDALRARKELNRQPNEARARECALAHSRVTLGDDAVARALADGAALDDDEACRLAMP